MGIGDDVALAALDLLACVSLVVANFSTHTLVLAGTISGGLTNILLQEGALEVGDGATNGSLGSAPVVNGGVLLFNRNDTFTLSNVISGPGALIQNGTGKLVLNQASGHTGGTTVNAGTLYVNGPNSASGTLGGGNITVKAGGTLLVGGDNSLVGYSTAGSRSIVIEAGGTLTNAGSTTCHLDALVMNGGVLGASAANAQWGNWYLDQGISTLGNGRASRIVGGNAALTQTGGTVFNIGLGDTLTVATTLAKTSSGADLGLVKQGAGTLVLASPNTYGSETTVSAGTLQIGDGSAAASIAGSGGIENDATLLFNHSDSVGCSGVISGTGSIVHTGLGTLRLSGANTYTGPTTVSNGVLEIAGAGVYSGTGLVAAGALRLNTPWAATPLLVTNGLVARYDADALTGLTDGGSVSVWPDSSGAGNSAALSAGTPTYQTGVLNGRAVVRFPSDGYSWFTLSARRTDIRTVFWVARESSTWMHFVLGDTAAGATYHFHRGSSPYPLWNRTYASSSVLNGTTRLNGVVVDGTSSTLGTGWNLFDVVTTGAVAAGTISMDRGNTIAGGGRSWAGDMAEILIYNAALSATQVQQVEAYLYSKWSGSVGAVGYSGAVTVQTNAAFGGYGTAGTVSVSSGGIIEGGYGGTGTLTLSNLTFSGAGTIKVTVASNTVPLVVSNVLTLGGSPVTAQIANVPGIGAYHVLQFGALAGAGSFMLSGNTTNCLATNGHYLDLVVSTPAISLAMPSGGQYFIAPATIPLSAAAAGNGHTVNQVQYYTNGVQAASSATGPGYHVNLSNMPPGQFNLTAVLTYDAL